MKEKIVFAAKKGDAQALLEEFFSVFPRFCENKDEKNLISRAWHLSLSFCKEAESYMRVAFIAAEAGLDAESVAAAMLHDAFNFTTEKKEVEKTLGENVCAIITSTSRIARLPIFPKTYKQAESIRKMIFALSEDIRVVLVKIAERLEHIRAAKELNGEEQKTLAEEVIQIWAPLSSRLGMASWKNELEDLSLKYTNADAFKQIKEMVDQKVDERRAYLDSAKKLIEQKAREAGIKVEIYGRAKHFYSIYQKMRKRNKGADELFDLLAIRMICTEKEECYALVGIVHELFKPLDGRFKDYIAMPKKNGYQSLHTTVIYEGRSLEIQIRTQKMHDIAEHGVASHFLYKKGMSRDMVSEDSLSLVDRLRQLGGGGKKDDAKVFASLKAELLGEKILVFTPKGDVRELVKGACAIDFAYSIHSSVGEKIVGAKADGRIISITQPLKNTEVIEILTSVTAHPTADQLNAAKTSRARQKINSWLTNNDPAFIESAREKEAEESAKEPKRTEKREKEKHENFEKRVCIAKVTNFPVKFAKCCNPDERDEIVGYVSSTRGVVIHRKGCATLESIPYADNKKIEATWWGDSKKE